MEIGGNKKAEIKVKLATKTIIIKIIPIFWTPFVRNTPRVTIRGTKVRPKVWGARRVRAQSAPTHARPSAPKHQNPSKNA